MSEQQGVTITLREIYDSTNELVKSIQNLETRFDRLEEKVSLAIDADERSRKALLIAQEAKEVSNKALEKVEETESNKRDVRQKLLLGILTSSIPWLITAIIGLIYIGKQGGF